MTLPVATYPFGLRDVKLYGFLDQQGTVLAEEGIDLPAAQTFSFADAADTVDLRGDDDLLAQASTGGQVNWTLEAGGISLQAWALLSGGTIIETGVAPNRKITLRKCSDDTRPYFQVRGLVMSENGGDNVAIVYRAKCSGDISGQFGDGAFFVTSADGVGFPMPGTKLLYDIEQHEQKTFLPLASVAIPITAPKNVMVVPLTATTATAIWEPVSTYTGYRVEVAIGPAFDTWVANPVVDPTDAEASLTGLTADSDYQLRVAGKIGTDIGDYSTPVEFSTPAA